MSGELVVVMPVYNEEAAIRGVVEEWVAVLEEVAQEWQFLIIDDGSTDDTPQALEDLQRGHPGRIEIMRHANRGHGQTVLAGYRLACQQGAHFVFQVDSDGQCDPRYFPSLWALRNRCDVVYGRRVTRRDGWKRSVASLIVKAVIFLCQGVLCEDANTPYRLMRTDELRDQLNVIPETFDLANIALAVQLKRARWRHGSVPIHFRARSGGEPKVPFGRFAAKALELAGDLLRF